MAIDIRNVTSVGVGGVNSSEQPVSSPSTPTVNPGESTTGFKKVVNQGWTKFAAKSAGSAGVNRFSSLKFGAEKQLYIIASGYDSAQQDGDKRVTDFKIVESVLSAASGRA